jgi:hypothetical protein
VKRYAEGIEDGTDEGRMLDIAARTGGTYTLTTDAERLREIYNTVADLEKTRFERERQLQYNELAPNLIVTGLRQLTLEAARLASCLAAAGERSIIGTIS